MPKIKLVYYLFFYNVFDCKHWRSWSKAEPTDNFGDHETKHDNRSFVLCSQQQLSVRWLLSVNTIHFTSLSHLCVWKETNTTYFHHCETWINHFMSSEEEISSTSILPLSPAQIIKQPDFCWSFPYLFKISASSRCHRTLSIFAAIA